MEENYSALTRKQRKELKKQEKERERLQAEKRSAFGRLILWGIAALFIFGAIFGIVKLASWSPSNQQAILTTSISPNDHIKGNPNAKVILIEYSDFQCPACKNYYPMLGKLNQDFGDKIQFAYRHFPLKQSHQNAEMAAYASEAAGIQAKFWQMHDLLFENQTLWAKERNAKQIFTNYAISLNLNVEKFKLDLDSKTVKDKVQNDYRSGQRADVESTPSFFLNGQKLGNPRSYDEFVQLINQAITSNS